MDQSHRSKRSRKGSLFFLCVLVSIDVFILYSITTNQTHAASVAQKDAATIVLSRAQQNSLKLAAEWKALLLDYPGSVDIAVYNHSTGETAQYATTTKTYDAASVIKLSILEDVLLQDQNAGYIGLTADQSDDAAAMIENSDNDAANSLWDVVGGASVMNDFYKEIGATQTTSLTDQWGLTQTTAEDQLKALNVIAYSDTPLSTTSVATATSLLDQVEPDQTWGVSAGVPSDVSFELKNGWLPDSETNDSYSTTDDWTVNSIGHIHGDGVDYTIAVVSDGNSTEQAGIDMIERLSAATWTTLDATK